VTKRCRTTGCGGLPVALRRRALGPGDHVHQVAVRVEADRGLRHHHHVAGLAQREADPGEGARAQRAVGVGQGGAHGEVAGAGVHRRFDRRHLGLEAAVGKRVHAQADPGADGHLAHALLGQGEVHVDRIQGLQADHRVTRVEVLAQVDAAEAQHAVERRADGLLRDQGALRLGPGAGLGGVADPLAAC